MLQQSHAALSRTRALLAELSETERLLISCLRTIAAGLAADTFGMPQRQTDRHIDEAIFDLIQSLGAVSQGFAAETERYLREAVAMARLN
jgi:hypothetical protein